MSRRAGADRGVDAVWYGVFEADFSHHTATACPLLCCLVVSCESSVFVQGCFAHLICVVQGVCQLVHQRGASVRLGSSRAGESYPAAPFLSPPECLLVFCLSQLRLLCQSGVRWTFRLLPL